MGFSPVQIDDMSLGQWIATVNGWTKAHAEASGKVEPPTEEEFRAAVDRGF